MTESSGVTTITARAWRHGREQARARYSTGPSVF